MTRDELTVEISARFPWFKQSDLDDLLNPATSDAEREDCIRLYKGCGVPVDGPSGWDTFLKTLLLCAEIAGAVLPIVGVVQTVYGLAKG